MDCEEFEKDEILVKNEIIEPEITVKTEDLDDLPNPDGLLLLPSDPAKKNTRCSYPMEYKLQIIQKAKESNNRSVARSEDLNESLVRQWRKNEDKIRRALSNSEDSVLSKSRFRLEGGGKKSMYSDLEEKVFKWVLSRTD